MHSTTSADNSKYLNELDEDSLDTAIKKGKIDLKDIQIRGDIMEETNFYMKLKFGYIKSLSVEFEPSDSKQKDMPEKTDSLTKNQCF
uniref:Chorein N-terminal domain-containing protein n=1 Tax=Ditylenchus dipsaci TaxID=166011 RepID=A0A915E9N9_9BILA